MSSNAPGRNDLCPCGSARKFKHCCLERQTADDSARFRLRGAEGRVVDTLTLTFELNVGVDEAFARLVPLARVRGEDHIDEVTRDESGAVTNAVLSWTKAGNRQHKDWDNTILGHLRLETDRLVAEVNSARRAERLKREIVKRLSGNALLIGTKVIDPTEALAERQRERASRPREQKPPRETSPELRAIEEDFARRQWKEWLDTRVPALGNKTPRQAARSASGRERLEALLAQFTRDAESGGADAASPVTFLRDRLRLPKPV